MTRAAGVLRSVYEPEDGSTRWNWRHNEQSIVTWGTGRKGPGCMHTVYATYGNCNTNFPRLLPIITAEDKSNYFFGEDPLLASLCSRSFILGTIVSLFFFREMKLSILSLSFVLYAATAFAVRFPIKKTRRHSLQPRSGIESISAFSSHVLASSSSEISDLRCASSSVCMAASMLKFSSSTINDMIYLTNVRFESLLDRFVHPRCRLP